MQKGPHFATARDAGARPGGAGQGCAAGRARWREIAGSRFIINSEAVLLLGPPGVGKTGIWRSPSGREAIVAGYTVLFSRRRRR
jgi:IstB-like ATP binding protein